MIFSLLLNMRSHPVWVCGLKLLRSPRIKSIWMSHPVWVCGLKPNNHLQVITHSSHTLYGCVDWNFCNRYIDSRHVESHPVWVCGLKRWMKFPRSTLVRSHPVWVCGLKHRQYQYAAPSPCHTLYGCVDWNTSLSAILAHDSSHTLYGCVDWNLS